MDVNSVSTDTNLEAALGERVPGPNGTELMLVKASANITTAAKKILVFTDADATEVSTSTTASDALVAGIVPAGITTISATAGRIDLGNYFYVVVSGVATAISAAAVAAGVPVGTSTTAGKADDATIAVGGAAGVSLESAAGVDEDIKVLVRL
jgi:hypothetical protein